jgi:hypothetical protein
MHGSPLANHMESGARSAPQAIIPLAGGKVCNGINLYGSWY